MAHTVGPSRRLLLMAGMSVGLPGEALPRAHSAPSSNPRNVPTREAAMLAEQYHRYVDVLNRRAWAELSRFVTADVQFNGQPVGVKGLGELLDGVVGAAPDIQWTVEMAIVQLPRIAGRLRLDCTPPGDLFGLPINGRRVRLSEHLVYQCEGDKISMIWGVLDLDALKAQL